ncbi:N-acetylmuramoyl-L-alanine amidase [Arthrobacter sp. SAFR-044]|uniref:N-acetylmuramoyl-L-alanine amidase n=1 Tax=Arthrobacter sp. SAFR-044 TaxID=3387278 RepID=UPI003F7B4860
MPNETFLFPYDGRFVVGDDRQMFTGWVGEGDLEKLQLEVPFAVSDSTGTVLDRGALRAYFFLDIGPRVGPHDDSNDTLEFANKLFLVNAAIYDRMVLDNPPPPRQGSNYLLRLLVNIGTFTSESAEADSLSEAEFQELAQRHSVSAEFVKSVHARFDELTSFLIDLGSLTPVTVAGTFLVKTDGEPLTRKDLDFYSVVADVPVRSASGSIEVRTLTADWGTLADPLDVPVNFEMLTQPTLFAEGVEGMVRVRVKGFDGATLWSQDFGASDPLLHGLKIEIPAHRPGVIEGTGGSGSSTARKRIRGQVLARHAGTRVRGLTVVLQGKTATDVVWRIVSAAETNDRGYFSMPYPRGVFVAAQALVSAAPDAAVDVGIASTSAEETVSEDFIYILLDDGGHAEHPEDCGCATKNTGVTRLPDQSDLINSDEYSQDLGGGCISITTPNRTLQEYAYNAIVRVSDPDVANYTLTRNGDGSFQLSGGAEKINRAPVDLGNPIRWQDAPLAGDALSFYQAVTVSTGHILFYKAVFKADGYSLGDLVYSLPLAPGQKKQIVSYDMANTLEASEEQRLTQSERLSATLVDDRSITDVLSGGIRETLAGQSSASTSGISAGLGLGGSIGAISGSLGVAGGYANSNSSASQSGSRGITQFFGEKLRQALSQNAESYRRLNASVVTTVKEGQEYAVTTEVVSNHNHCHSITMMYFEVLRHYAISQELADVQECVFVPFLLTEFNSRNISKWKDVLTTHLLPMPSSTYLRPMLLRGSVRQQHPLTRAFDANERILSGYSRVDFPLNSYAEDPITEITGEFTLRTRLPRPRTRYDRIVSLPVVTKTVSRQEIDIVKTAAVAVFTGGLSLLGGPGTNTVEEEVLVKTRIFDAFMDLDANFQSVRPADAIRVKSFAPKTIEISGNSFIIDFFQNPIDRQQWESYSNILGEFSDVHQMLDNYFAGRLISEWEGIFNRDIAPLIFNKIVDTIRIGTLNLDLTAMSRYNGGERAMQIRLSGGSTVPRKDLPEQMRLHSNSQVIHGLRSAGLATLIVDKVRIRYITAHYSGDIHNGYSGNDLLDEDFATSGALLATPLTSQDRRNPRKEDTYLVEELVAHLNSNLEHYNKALWRTLDADRRFMLLDGFNIQIFNRFGAPLGYRSLSSVVKHELITVAGNSLVFPVADGYNVSQALIVENKEEEEEATPTLRDHYLPLHPVEPYRLSVPTRGVYMEALMGQCDACEEVKPDSSQDWDLFRTEEPTAIQQVVTPTPQRTDWKAIWAQFAQPLVTMQTPREAPAPGSGLEGLSTALVNSQAFRDVTGLAGNQENVIRTYLSNQENAKAFAEMAKTMAMQDHNSANSRSIMRSLEEAHDAEAITDPEYRQLVRDHLGQQIDGGARQQAETAAQASRRPSLTTAAVEALDDGRSVTAKTTHSDGSTEEVQVSSGRSQQQEPIHYDVALVPQPNKTSCWAAAMAMLEGYRRSIAASASVVLTATHLAAEVGYSLEQSYGWDRLEDVKDFYGFKDIQLVGSQYPTAAQWRQWLRERGPLYVTVVGEPSSHAIVIHGIAGDETATGARVEVLDPWDISQTFDSDPTVFNPPNEGTAITLSVDELNRKFNGGDLSKLAIFEDWRILYLPGLEADAGTTAPTGAAKRTFRIQGVNKFLATDTDVRFKASIVSGSMNLTVNVKGNTWKDVNEKLQDGVHDLTITPDHSVTEPADWPGFAATAAVPLPDRMWLEERAEVTVTGNRITAITGNPNIVLRGDSITVKLRPLWAKTPHKSSRPTGVSPDYVVLHHTAGNSDLPPHFVDPTATEKAAAHYVITRTGEIIKMAHEASDAANHAGRSMWKGRPSLNTSSIGIEIVHLNDTVAYEEVQYVALLALLGQLKATYPATKAKNFIGHSDIGLHPNGDVGRKALDPGKRLDWPRLETAGFGLAPADASTIFTASNPVEDIYGAIFKADTNIKLPIRRGQPPNYSAVVTEVKSDLAAIGYAIPSAGSSTYDDGTDRAIQVFKNRFFSGSRIQPDSFYNGRLEFETAQMIKRVLHTANLP